MSFKAKLYFTEMGYGGDYPRMDGDSYTVLECSWEFHVADDRNLRRTEKPRGGYIYIVLESDSRLDGLHWIMDGVNTRHGEIVFFKKNMMAKGRKVTFKFADCTHYSEEFNAEGNAPMRTRLTISTCNLTVDDTKVSLWAGGWNLGETRSDELE